ncbi:uncharacterized protein LOC119893362 [Micropterus salmoides]|uniref:uncharacterized protein LOC119893362 n=1 Tax=Micropterus salmoides TaxID=27706 RepID=UPI0018EDF0D9|nr:uncharacterized protein LOC119893362 [Micropterus salmoides]
MIGRDIALEALGILLNANVTSVQNAGSQSGYNGDVVDGRSAQQHLSIKNFIPTIFDADETSLVSRSTFSRLQSFLEDGVQVEGFDEVDMPTRKHFLIDENEFFHPNYDYDFTHLKDTKTYYRGGEVYERPCGWKRFALRVLDKYDGNTWLGNRYRSTESVPGEWPVSYHGTSKEGAEGIIAGFYKPGPRQLYGRGIYSTPNITEAKNYAKTFTSKNDGKRYKVVLQNRINPAYRQKHRNNGDYWLVSIPEGTSVTEEQKMVERAIRPYGLLLREV